MIKYSLECKECSLTFESWFASSHEYERLKKLELNDNFPEYILNNREKFKEWII